MITNIRAWSWVFAPWSQWIWQPLTAGKCLCYGQLLWSDLPRSHQYMSFARRPTSCDTVNLPWEAGSWNFSWNWNCPDLVDNYLLCGLTSQVCLVSGFCCFVFVPVIFVWEGVGHKLCMVIEGQWPYRHWWSLCLYNQFWANIYHQMFHI